MRCATCQYELWDIRSRTCPECGTGFRPSEQEFVPGGVQFCCPHCDQHYFGTGPRGELVPRAFNCLRCGQAVDMDEMVLRPADRSRPNAGLMRLPWDDRASRGRLRILFSHMALALFLPLRLGTMLRMRGAAGGGFVFFLVVTLLTAALSVLPIVLLFGVVFGGMASAAPGGGMGPAIGAMSGMAGGMILVFFAIPLLFMLLWVLVTHGILIMSGEVAGGIRRTFDAICFSGGAYIMGSIPCFGSYVGLPWWVVSSVMVVRNAQGVSTMRAVVATLLLPGLTIVGTIIAYAWFMFWAMSVATTAGGGGGLLASSQLSWVGDSLIDERVNGRFPDHILRPVARTGSPMIWFAGDSPWTTINQRPLAGENLAGFEARPASERMALVDRALSELRESGMPHRVWAMVYLLPGAEVDPQEPFFRRLWLVAHAPYGVKGDWRVLQLDGNEQVIRPDQQDAEIDFQNTLREAAGLPPIPAPLEMIDERGFGPD